MGKHMGIGGNKNDLNLPTVFLGSEFFSDKASGDVAGVSKTCIARILAKANGNTCFQSFAITKLVQAPVIPGPEALSISADGLDGQKPNCVTVTFSHGVSHFKAIVRCPDEITAKQLVASTSNPHVDKQTVPPQPEGGNDMGNHVEQVLATTPANLERAMQALQKTMARKPSWTTFEMCTALNEEFHEELKKRLGAPEWAYFFKALVDQGKIVQGADHNYSFAKPTGGVNPDNGDANKGSLIGFLNGKKKKAKRVPVILRAISEETKTHGPVRVDILSPKLNMLFAEILHGKPASNKAWGLVLAPLVKEGLVLREHGSYSLTDKGMAQVPEATPAPPPPPPAAESGHQTPAGDSPAAAKSREVRTGLGVHLNLDPSDDAMFTAHRINCRRTSEEVGRAKLMLEMSEARSAQAQEALDAFIAGLKSRGCIKVD